MNPTVNELATAAGTARTPGRAQRNTARTTAALRSVALPFVAGGVFALGLGLSGMTQPAKVIGFLDVAGAWDPSLAFVMGGAVGTYALLLWLARRRRAARGTAHSVPQGGETGQPAAALRVDRRLLGGSALFGIGWGLVGLCPGPALVVSVTALPGVLAFVAAMVGGMLAVRFAPALWLRLRGVPADRLPADAPQECGPVATRAA